MAEPQQPEKSIFLAAIDIASDVERAEFLAQACAGHPALRAQVDALLQAHAQSQPLLDVQPGPGPTLDQSDKATGTMIGPYKLIEPIGEGGMGTVWMAQQTAPVKRLVAVKLIKAGMDSKHFIARFEAERQALALMEHPNIAKVLDAGTIADFKLQYADCNSETSSQQSAIGAGRPYLVMELVRGIPITRYCDEHYLTPRQRVELFLPVCHAIQHAHQKGIIHRDLKPSNVLVALYDGKPVPKVIDFGVAKAAGQPLTEQTLVTGFGAIVGTLEYMSPEQAELNQLDIDTRSDIYSLGVLLYELLTGTTPFSRKGLEKVGMLEMLRVIREQEPSKPSTKLSTAEGLPALAANRGTEPAKLTRLIRGELDWIVMKALEKNRSRRYETANGFAMDVQRYLADEAVHACPPSAWYRLTKFLRRNKAPVIAASLVLLALVAGVVGTGLGLVRALNAEKTAVDAKREAETNLEQALKAADTFFTRVSESKLLDKPALQPFRKELLEEAQKQYLELFNKKPNDPRLKAELAASYLRMVIVLTALEEGPQAVQALEKGLDLIEPLVKAHPGDRELVARLAGICTAERPMFRGWVDGLARCDIPNGLKTLERACDLWKKLADDFPDLADVQGDYATLLMYQGDIHFQQERYRECQRLYEQADARFTQAAGVSALSCEHRINAASARYGASFHLSFFGQVRVRESLEKCAESVKMFEDLLHEFPDKPVVQLAILGGQFDLVEHLIWMSRPDEAEALQNRMIENAEKLVATHPDTPSHAVVLSYLYAQRIAAEERKGRMQIVEADYRKSVEALEKAAAYYPDSPRVQAALASQYLGLGAFHLRRGDGVRARALTEQAVALLEKPGADADDPSVLMQLGTLYVHLAAIEKIQARPEHAEKAYRAAIAKQSQFLRKHARQEFINNPDFHGSYGGLFDLLKSAGRTREANNFIRETIAEWENVARDAERYEFRLQVAQIYALARMWDKAAEAYSNTINKWPHRVEPLRGRATAYSNLGKHDQAAQDYGKLIDFGYRDPASAWMYEARANAYRALKQDEKALADLTEATKQWPFLVEPWMWRGNLYRDQGQWHKAIDDYSEAIKLKPEHTPAWQGRVLAYAKMNAWDKATADLKEISQQPSKDPSHRDLVARLHVDCGAWQAAHALKNDALENYRKAAAIWVKLADDVSPGRLYREHAVNVLLWRLGPALQQDGRAAEAEQAFKQAVNECEELAKILPIKPEIRITLGYAYSGRAQALLSLGKRQEAEQLLDHAIEKWSDIDHVWMARAWLRGSLQQPDKARADFEKAFEAAEAAIKNWPNSGYVWRTRGQLNAALQRPAQALADFSKAIEVAPKLDAWNYRERANAYLALKQEEEALVDLSKAIEQWPDLWEARFWRADFHRDRGQWEKAIRDYSKALELNPSHWPARRARGLSHGKLNQWDAALSDLMTVVEQQPDQALDQFHHLQAAKRNLEGEKLLRASIGVLQKAVAEQANENNLPHLGQCWRTLAHLLQTSEHPKEREAALNHAIDIFAKLAKKESTTASHRDLLARCRYDLALFQRQHGETDAAERNLRQAIELWTKLAADIPAEPVYLTYAVNEFLHQLRPLLVETGRAAEAEQFFARAFPQWAKSARPGREDHRNALADAMGLWGRLLFDMGKRQQAEELAAKVVEQWPENAHALIARGRIRMALGHPAEALDDFDSAIRIAPKDGMAPWWHLDRSYAYTALKQDDKTLEVLTDATRRWPELWDAWMWRAQFHFDRQRWNEAVADYTRGLALNRGYALAWRNRGFAAVRVANWERAREDYAEAISLEPKDANLTHELAWLLAHCPDQKVVNPKRAVELARRAVGLDPKNGAYRGTLGSALYRAGDWKAAIAELTASIKLRPNHGADMMFLAMAHKRLDQDAEARGWYDRAIEWIEKNAPKDEELRRFRDEAKVLLKLKG